MIAAKRNVIAAQNNFRLRLKLVDILNNFLEAIVPVGHCRLYHNKIERAFFGQEIGKQTARQAEPPKVAWDCFEGLWSRDLPPVKPASTPPVGLILLLSGHNRDQPVEVIEQLKVGLATQKSGHAKHSGGLEPEIA